MTTRPPRARTFGAGEVSERCINACGGIKFNTFAWGKVDGGLLDLNGQVWENARLVSVELVCTKNTKEMWRYPASCKDTAMFKLDRTWASMGELRGVRDGLKFGGIDFLNSRWTIELYDGEKLVSKNVQTIKAYEFNPLQKPHALHYYTFMFFGDGTNGGEKGVWTPACTETTDPMTGLQIGTKALAYDNLAIDTTTGVISKREDSLYLACISAAVGKAGNWGYPAWEIGAEDFTTAVRTVRADYCGDGDSWTTKGNALQATDVWGYSQFASYAPENEAMWGDKGALCLGTPRWINTYKYTDVKCNGALLPPCKNAVLTDYPDAIIWTKLP